MILTLYEFNRLIRAAIETDFPDTYFITSEIASMRVDRKGHCYIEFIQKDENGVIAQIRATIWSYNYRIISHRFKTAAGITLSKGLKVMVEAEVSFHERYGLSLNILDIDPSYTLGEIAIKRREILERLSRENLINKNREIEFPVLPLKLAVISSPNAAGYEDFISHIRNNRYNYDFDVTLFSAIMQGDNAEPSIIEAFDKLLTFPDRFDLAIIIRGGGAEADLHCFDGYEIGKAVANLPIPLISGIGHERDRTVVDEVAHTSVKTPTAAAELIIQRVRDFHIMLVDLETRLMDSSTLLFNDTLKHLYKLSRDMEKSVTGFLAAEAGEIRSFVKSLALSKKILRLNMNKIASIQKTSLYMANSGIKEARSAVEHTITLFKAHLKTYINNAYRTLEDGRNILKLLNPTNVLKRGYGITYKNNVVLKDTQNISRGDIIHTLLYNGKITSNVLEVEKNGEETTTDI